MGLTQVNSDGVSDGSIKNADIKSDAAIAASKLSGLAASATTDTTNADNIGSGTLAAARVPDLAASKITSGTIATARLGTGTGSNSNYLRGDGSWQEVPPAYDDTSLRRDLTTLALQTAVDTNRKAYNLQNSFVDQFEDDSGIGSHSNSDRIDEKISTEGALALGPHPNDSDTLLLLHFEGSDGDTSGTGFNDSSSTGHTMVRTTGYNSQPKLGSASNEHKIGNTGMIFNDEETETDRSNMASISFADHNDWNIMALSNWTIECWIYIKSDEVKGYMYSLCNQAGSNSTDAAGSWSFNINRLSQSWADNNNAGDTTPFLNVNIYRDDGTSSGSGFDAPAYTGSSSGTVVTTQTKLEASDFTSGMKHIAVCKQGGTMRFYIDGVQKHAASCASGALMTGAGANLGGDLWIGRRAYTNTYGQIHGFMDEFRMSKTARYPDGTTFAPNQYRAVNATGNVISTANTASSSRTKVSGVMTYENTYGTATLGTDLKIYFTCNGGTNWTEAASYTAGSDFSTGVKTVYLGETTCTAGTDIRYKAEWANQASGSKVTKLVGIGLNY